jgi:predicted tellurium resistance membrane protein TerC
VGKSLSFNQISRGGVTSMIGSSEWDLSIWPYLIGLIGIFLITREFVMWYWKINEALDEMKNIGRSLKSMENSLNEVASTLKIMQRNNVVQSIESITNRME